MGQTLTHGIYLPDEGERNCYDGLASNWSILDGAVGTIAEHTTALAGKAPAVHTHTKSDITDFPAYGNSAGTICEGNDSRLSDARTPVAHTHTKSDVTDLLNSNFIPSSDANYTLGSSDLRWKQIWCSGYKTKSGNIDFTDSTTTGSAQSWWIDAMEKNGTGFFGVGSIRSHSAGLNEEHFRIKNAGGKWADLYIQLGDNNQFTIGTSTHSDVTNNGFKGKFTPLNSFIPNANNSYDLGSASYQWNNLYAKNYYYNGVAWGLDKANTWSQSQTISASTNKAYIIINTSYTLGEETPSSTKELGGVFFKDLNGNNAAYLNVGHEKTTGDVYTRILTRFKFDNGVKSITGSAVNTALDIGLTNSAEKFVRPSSNNEVNLGTSTNKWKALNGINPGALSLPDTLGISGTENVNYFNVIGYLNNTGTLATIPSTATYDGWLYINAKDGADSYIIIDDSPSSFGTSVFGNNGLGAQSIGLLCLMCPIRKGHAYNVRIKSAGIVSARIYPAQGNV